MGRRAQAVRKGAKTAARGVGLVVLPAVPTAGDLIVNRKSIKTSAASHMRAIRAGEQGAKIAALKTGAKALGPLSTFVLPAIAGVAAISTARDAYKRRGRIDEALEEGGVAALDVVLGNALTEYNNARAEGDSRARAVVEATLKGLDNRFMFGLFQRGMRAEQARSREESERLTHETSEFGQEIDPSMSELPSAPVNVPRPDVDPTTLRISQHDAAQNARFAFAGRLGAPDAAAPKRLDAAQRKEFARAAARKGSAAQSGAANDKSKGTGEARRGWANPAVQKAAQQARGAQNISDWANDSEPKGA